MGVTGLWRLIDASGKPVPLESLEGKVLAIDISIWIHQVLQGYQDKRGNSLPNAHLLGLYNRICKLLYFKIKPIFVFDGGVPLLKKNTIAARKKQKILASNKAEKMKNDLIVNLMKHSLVKNVLTKKPLGKVDAEASTSNKSIKTINDMFNLPMAPPLQAVESCLQSDDTESDSDELSPRKQSKWRGNIHTVDITSDDFKALPPDVRYDILTDLKETRKQNSWGRLHEIPQESDQFSNYQMKRLLKRRQAQEFLEAAEQEMGGKNLTLEELEKLMCEQGVDTNSRDMAAYRIASDATTRIIYINDPKASQPSSQVDKRDDLVGLCSDPSQASCSRDLDFSEELSVTPEELSSVVDNIGEYDLDDWDSDIEEIVSPVTPRFFGKVQKNPALAYMTENSQLSQEQILALIEESKLSMKRAKMKCSGTEYHLRKNKKRNFHLQELIEIEDDIEEISATVHDFSGGEKKEEKEEEEEEEDKIKMTIKDMRIRRGSSDDSHDSNDFVEVKDVEIPLLKSDTKMEIVIKVGEGVHGDEDDLFADVFEKKTELGNAFRISGDQITIEEQEGKYWNKSKNIMVLNSREGSKNNLSNEENLFIEKIDNDQLKKSTIPNIARRVVKDDNETAQKEKEKEKNFQTPNNDNSIVTPTKTTRTAAAAAAAAAEINCGSFQNSSEDLGTYSTSSNLPSGDGGNFHEISEITTAITKNSETAAEISEFICEKDELSEKPSDRITSILTRLTCEKSELLSKASDAQQLEELRSQLVTESEELKQNIGKLDRQSTEVTEQMRSDAQELLRLFGIPYIVAPQEAEAQCAYLETINLTDGSITDDSDIWLFGGKCVYRNFFNNAKKVMQYLSKDIEHHFKLTREQMIQLALLVGSDYTVGIPGIGPVTAMEILASFPTEGDDLLRGLTNFSLWMRGGKIVGAGRAALKNKLKNINVDRGFPSQAVVQAYLFPTVDESKETFSWGKPNLVLLADYTREKFGWTRAKFEETMGPVMKRLEAKSQKDMMAYFKVIQSVPKAIEQGLSKRVQKAVERMGSIPVENENDDEVAAEGTQQILTKYTRRKRRQAASSDKDKDGSIEIDSNKEAKEIIKKQIKEVIPQRERDKQNALNKKLKAIEVFRRSRKGPGKSKTKNLCPKRNTVQREAKLSESSSESE